jgi:multimeric flavodoxin WrbA
MACALAILGSSRREGNTHQLLDAVVGEASVEVIDLADHEISPYDYAHRNIDDDFIAIVDKMVQADVILFATPVYWYSMSAPMKVFVDRLSDLVTVRKDLGRALKGKWGYVLATSSTPDLPPGYEVPFALTCDYLDMHWGGIFHGYFEHDSLLMEETAAAAREFGEALLNKGSCT